MNSRAEIWNVLHDGGIIRAQKQDSGDLILTIDIPYLARMISEADHIILTLKRCSQFCMKIWEQDLITDDLALIAEQGTEILSTESEDSPVHVLTTLGEIDAEFDSFALALKDGTEVTFEAMRDTCEKYWNRWEQESKTN